MSHLSTEQAQPHCRVEPKKVSSSHAEQHFKSSTKRPALFGQRWHIQRYSQRLSEAIEHLNEAKELINFRDIELIIYYLDPNSYPIRQSILTHIGDEQIASNCLLGFVKEKSQESIIKNEHKNRVYLEQIVLRLLKNQIDINQIKNIVQNKQISLSNFENILRVIALLKGILLEQFFGKIINTLLPTFWNKLQTLSKDHACTQLNNVFRLFLEILIRQANGREEELNIHFNMVDNLYKEDYLQKAIQYFNHFIFLNYELNCISLSNEKIIQNIINKIIHLRKQSIQISMPQELFTTFIRRIKITKDQMIQVLTLFKQEEITNTLLINQPQLSIQCIYLLINHFDNCRNIPKFIQTDFLFSAAERFRQINDLYQINKIILNKYESCITIDVPQSNYFLRKLLNYKIKEKSLEQIITQLQIILSQSKEKEVYMKDRINILQRIRWIVQSIIPKIQQGRISQNAILMSIFPTKTVLELLRQFVMRAYQSQLLPKICSILDGLIQFKYTDNDTNIWVFVKQLSEIQFQSNFSSLLSILQSYKHLKQFAISCYLTDNINGTLHEFKEQQLNLLLKPQQSLSPKRKQLIYYLICLPERLSNEKVEIICQFLIKIEPASRCTLLQQLMNILSQRCYNQKEENKVNLLFHNVCMILSAIYNKISLQQKNNITIYQKTILMQQQFRQFKHSQIDYLFLLKLTETQMHIRNTLNTIICHNFKELLQTQCCILEYFLDLIIISQNNADLQSAIKLHFPSLVQQLKCLYFKIFQINNKPLQLKIIRTILLILKIALFSKDIQLIQDSIKQLSFNQLTIFLKDCNHTSINPLQKIPIQITSILNPLALAISNKEKLALPQFQLLNLTYFLTLSSDHCQFGLIVLKYLQNEIKDSRMWIFGLRFIADAKQLAISHLWKYFILQFADGQLDSNCKPFLECICYCLANHDIAENIMQQLAQYFQVKLFSFDDYSFFIILESLKQKLIRDSSNLKVYYWRALLNSLILAIKRILNLQKQIKYSKPEAKIIANLGLIIQIISLFIAIQPKQYWKDIVPVIKVILSAPTLEFKLLVNKVDGIKHISIFHYNSFVNIALQFLASSKYFMRIFMALQFDISTSPICFVLQKTLINLSYSCLDTIGCFQLIKTIGCFCREEQDCLSFIKWLLFSKISRQLDSQKNQAIMRLFTLQYSRGEICRCCSYYDEGRKNYFQIGANFLNQHQSSNQKKLKLCLLCFVFKNQVFSYKQLPKHFFLKQSNVKQIKQSFQFKIDQNNLNEGYCKYSMCLLMLFHKGQYCYAKRLKGVWHIILPSKNIIRYNNLYELFGQLYSLAIQLYCCIYEQEQIIQGEINYSQSSLHNLQQVNSFNRRIILRNAENQNTYKQNIASSFLNIVSIIRSNNHGHNLDLFELIDLYSQRYQFSQNFNSILAHSMDHYIEYLINNYINGKDNHILNKLKKNHRRWKQNYQYYKQFYSVVFLKVIEKKRYVLNVSIRKQYQQSIAIKDNIRKQMQLVEEIMKQVQNILLIPLGVDKEMNENSTIGILSNIISFTSEPYTKIHLFSFLLNNSTLAHLITIYINEQTILNKQGQRNLFYIISQCINFLIDQRNLSQDDYQLSPNDHKSLFWSNFIQSVILKSNGKDSIQLLQAILNFSVIMDSEHKIRVKILFRIMGFFYYRISLSRQSNHLQSELLQLLINNVQSIEQLNCLLGYKVGSTYLNCFRLFDLEEIKVGLISIIQGLNHQKKSQYFYCLLNLLHKNSYSQKYIKYIQQLCYQAIKASHNPSEKIDIIQMQEGQESYIDRRLMSLVNEIMGSLDIYPVQALLNQQNLEKRILVSQKEVDNLNLDQDHLKITFRLVETCSEKTDNNKAIKKQKVKNLIVDIICEKETSYEYILELKEKSKSQWKGPKLIYLKSTSNKNLLLKQKKTIILTQQPSKKKSKFSKFDILIH